jgi:prepilin-type N-terminal cleavage/methylation domain-containing protein
LAAVKNQHGATLVELLVALALLGTVAVLSAQLVIQSTKLMDTVARAARNPDLVLAGEWIRRDLYGAVAVVGEDLGWTHSPLIVVSQSGGWVVIAAFEGQLVRTNSPPGLPPDIRILLRGVVGWRWRVIGDGAVVIELQAFANPDAHENLTGAAGHRLTRQIERLTLALRGKPAGRAW